MSTEPTTIYNAKDSITFKLGSGDQFLSPEFFLSIQCQILNGDQTELAAGSAVAVSPCFAQSLFSDIEININGQWVACLFVCLVSQLLQVMLYLVELVCMDTGVILKRYS